MLINSYRFATATTYDTDAQAYITAVETVDGASLETATRDAINAFVVGCKADGIWPAIKASCILAGARTLAGALVPLLPTMPAPTNNGFIGIGTDYVRKTGLVGNGSTRYLNSNRAKNADPQNNVHLAVYQTTAATVTTGFMSHAGAVDAAVLQVTQIASGVSVKIFRARDVWAGTGKTAANDANGLQAISRASGTSFSYRVNGSTSSIGEPSIASATSESYYILAQNNSGTIVNYSNARLAFYSIGESLDLALLDTRVTALITAFSTAIP